MQRRLALTIDGPDGPGALLLRLFDSGPRRGFADCVDHDPALLGINLVLAGHLHFTSRGSTQELQPGGVFIRRPGTCHSSAGSHDYAELSVSFAPSHLSALATLGLPGPEDVHQGNPWRGAVAAMRALMQRSEESSRPGSAILLAAAAFAAECIERSRCAAPHGLARAKAHIDADPSRPASIASLARHAGMGTEAFRRAFRLHYGLGPIAYRQRRRLDLALCLLENQCVKEVAGALGYRSPAAFSAQFKRHFGVPPSRA